MTPHRSPAARLFGHRHHRPALRPLVAALVGASLLSSPGLGIGQVAPATLPTGLQVVQGQVQTTLQGQTLTVTNSANSILNWQSFSIGSGNAVHFAQPGAQSQVLNRVVGSDPSSILGSLTSNGRVWLLNPNGVIFGQGARVDVAGLVASTLNLNDIDWLGGRYTLASSGPAAALVNQGELRSSLGGQIALVGGSVRNEGVIDARGGQVLLAAGRSVELIDTGTPNLRLKLSAPQGEALNLGTLSGGRVDVMGAVVNQRGIARADALGTNAAGEVVLTASEALTLAPGSTTSASGGSGGRIVADSGPEGTTLVGGLVQARGEAGPGGQVQLLGRHVGLLNGAVVDASGHRGGGEVLIGGGERGQDASVRNAQAIYIDAGAQVAADATGSGHGGRIIAWGDLASRVYGRLSARGGAMGGDGGFIETSGGWLDATPAHIDVTSAFGRPGTWLLDPFNIFISDSVTGTSSIGTSGTNPVTFTAVDNGSRIAPSTITTALNNGNSVIISTGTTGTEAGDILVLNATLGVAPNVPVSLTLQAARRIDLTNARIESTGSALTVNLQAAGSGIGGVNLTAGSRISTQGGNISINGVGYDGVFSPIAPLISGFGVYLSGGSTLVAGTGTISLTGTRAALTAPTERVGVLLSGAQVSGRDIIVNGNSGSQVVGNAVGVGIGNSTLQATRTLSITGNSAGTGVAIDTGLFATGPSSLRVTPPTADTTASMTITGSSSWTDFAAAGYSNYGVDISGQYGGSIQLTNGANLRIAGTNGGGLAALNLSSDAIVTTTSPVGGGGGSTVQLIGNGSAALRADVTAAGSLLVQANAVVLVEGAALRSNAPGNALVVASSSFLNQAGGGALSAPNGRWLVYGLSPAQVQAGGLAPAFKQYNASFGTLNPLTPATGNGLLYSIAPTIVFGGDAFSKVYDGTATAGALSAITTGFTGLIGGDVLSFTAGATGLYGDPNVGNVKPIAVPTAAFNVADANGVRVLGYGITSNLLGDITPRPLTVTGVTAANKVYDGNPTATLSNPGNLNNLVPGQTLVLSNTGASFADPNAGAGKTVTVGGLALANGSGLASNYQLAATSATTTADITPRPLTVTGLVAANKVYDGNASATLSNPGSLSGLVPGQTLVLSNTGASFTDANAAAGKTVTVSGLAIANGSGLASNYQLTTPSATTTADITPRPLTITANDATKVFGNTLSFTGTEFGSSGLLPGETVGSVALTSAGTAASASVAGGPYAIVPSNATGGSFRPANYAITYVNGTLTVTPLSLSAVLASIVGNPTKVYDGSDAATLAPANYRLSGFVGSDGALVTQTAGRYDSANAGARTVTAGLAAGDFTALGSTDLRNYSLPTSASGSGTITPRLLTVTGLAAANKVYDGNAIATLSNPGSLSGLVPGQTLVLSNTGASFADPNAGAGKTVTVGGLAIANGSGLASNYQLVATSATTTADITPRPLTVTGLVAANKVYDGNASATLSNPGSLSGLVPGQTLVLSNTGASFTDANAAAGKTVTVSGLAIANGSGLASNYQLTTPSATTTADITPRPLTITANDATKVFGNTLSFTGAEFGSSGLLPGETVGSVALTSAGTAASASVAGGPYAIVPSNATGGSFRPANYAITYVNGTLTVTPLSLSAVLAGNPTKVYDGSDAATLTAANYRLSGFVGSDGALVTQTAGRYDSANAGARTITASLAAGDFTALGSTDLRNYSLPTSASGSGTITPRLLTVTGLAASNKVYDGTTTTTLSNPGSLSGLVPGQTLVLSNTGASFADANAAAGKTVTVGGLAIANGSGLASNYQLAAASAATTADITPRPLTLGRVTAADKVYDGNTSATLSLGALGNLVGNETLVVSATGRFDTRDVGNGKRVDVSLGFADGANGGRVGNYALPPAPTDVRAAITPATLTYTANPASKRVGDPVPALSGRVSGFVAGDTLASATTGNLSFTTPAQVNSPEGRYAIDGGGLNAGNYRFVQAEGNATALEVAGVVPQAVDNGSLVPLRLALSTVQAPPGFSSPGSGRVFDVLQALQARSLGERALFEAVEVEALGLDRMTTLLAARNLYKKTLFAEALRRLEQDPTLADLPACTTTKEVENGSCLITEDLKRALQAERATAQVAVAPAPPPAAPAAPAVAATAPASAPAAAPASPAPSPAPAPPPAPVAQVAAATPAPAPIQRRRVRAASLPQIERKLAVVIGIDQYADKSIPQLDNAVGDARAIAALLENRLGYETLVLANASRQEVVRALNRLAVELGPRDSVVVYYAGHGELVEASGQGYWQLADSQAQRPESWLSNADITRLVAQIGASQVALVSDSCYSGSLVEERFRGAPATADPKELLARKSVVVMSSGGNEPVFDAGKQGHSPFAFSLMSNLEKVASWQVGGNLFERVRFAVARELPQRPRYGTASAAGHQAGGDYLFEQRQLDAKP